MRYLLLLLPLVACDTWDKHPSGWLTNLDDAWSPSEIVVATDGLYVPVGNGVVLVDASGATEVDVGDLTVDNLELTLTGEAVLARGRTHICADDNARTWTDCDSEDRTIAGSTAVLQDGDVASTLQIPSWYRAFTYSEDGRFAVASLDPTLVQPGQGVVSLDSLLVADLQAGTTWEVAVGFAADEVLFTEDSDGAADGVVVLSNNEVAVIDLTEQVPLPDVVFPLTLDASALIDPVGIELTPSGEHALISVRGSSDLYALDLVDPSVNIIGLASTPTAMAVDTANNRTAFVYNSRPVVEFVDHDFFGVAQLELETAMTDIIMTEEYALLWRPGSQRIARVELATNEVDHYRLNFSTTSVRISPDESFAVVLSTQSAPRMEIVNLARNPDDGRLDADPRPFALDGIGLGIAFEETAAGTDVLILQNEVDTLYQLSWPTLALETIALPAPPRRIGSMPEGGFWIAHDDPMGLISFYTPGSAPTTVANFAVTGLLDNDVPFTTEVE